MLVHGRRTRGRLLTVQVQVIAAVEEAKAIGTGTTTNSVLQDTREDAGVDISDRAGDSLLVAAGDNGVIATLGLGVLEGDILGDGVLHTVTLAANVVAGGKGHSSGSEEESSGEELHFDGFGWIRQEK